MSNETPKTMSGDEFIEYLDALSRNTPVYKRIYYAIYRNLRPREIRYRFNKAVTWKIQRANRGWSVYDTWSFDDYLATVLAGGIKHLREHNHGHPVTVCSCPDKAHTEPGAWDTCDGEARWNEILDEMVEGFEAYTHVHDLDYAQEQEARAKCRRSLELMTEHFGSLWD